MIIPPNYTPIQVILPNDKLCISIHDIWRNIYQYNKDTYSYVSHVSLARKYNLIYSLIKTDKLKEIKFSYIVIPTSSAENIEFYKLDNACDLILKEENNIKGMTDIHGSKYWYKNGLRHRDNDLPALIYHNGKQEWFKNGSRHRDNDLPAAIYPDGTQIWYEDGRYHRDNDLPALIHASGTQEWYQNGELHRDNDLPAAIYHDGTQKWFKNGKLHRDNDLPAVILEDGSKLWYKHGVRYDYPS